MAILETVNPGVSVVEEAAVEYSRLYPDFSDAIQTYAQIMIIQQRALNDLQRGFELDEAAVVERLCLGRPLIEADELEVDEEDLRRLVREICRCLDQNKPGGFPYGDAISEWEGLEPSKLPATIKSILRGEPLAIDAISGSEGELELASSAIWEALAPFYRAYGNILQVKIDQSVWQRGYCPICGSRPLMGQFRKGDGLWLLECAFCHMMWNVQRASCPFCTEKAHGALTYFYTEEIPGYRVQYCELCHCYVKTVDLRESDREVLLPFEDIVTFRLDIAAREEGLKSSEGIQ